MTIYIHRISVCKKVTLELRHSSSSLIQVVILSLKHWIMVSRKETWPVRLWLQLLPHTLSHVLHEGFDHMFPKGLRTYNTFLTALVILTLLYI